MEPCAKNNESSITNSHVLVLRLRRFAIFRCNGTELFRQDLRTGQIWHKNGGNNEDRIVTGGKTPGNKTNALSLQETRSQETRRCQETTRPQDFANEMLSVVKQALSQNHVEDTVDADCHGCIRWLLNDDTAKMEIAMVASETTSSVNVSADERSGKLPFKIRPPPGLSL